MPTTNDSLKSVLEARFPDYDVEVEGVGHNHVTALPALVVHLRNKEDGHEHVVDTRMTVEKMLDECAKAVKHKK